MWNLLQSYFSRSCNFKTEFQFCTHIIVDFNFSRKNKTKFWNIQWQSCPHLRSPVKERKLGKQRFVSVDFGFNCWAEWLTEHGRREEPEVREDTRHALEPVRGERVLQLLPSVQRHPPGVQAGGSGAAVRRCGSCCSAAAGARRADGRATPQRGEPSQCHVTLQGGEGLVQRLLMPRSVHRRIPL